MTFENFYEYPLSDEALECTIGQKIFVDQLYTRGMVTFPRLARVIEIRDTTDGRYVRFEDNHELG